MKPVDVETTIQRPIEEVFDFLDVLANHERFTDHFLVDWTLSGPPSGVGAEVRLKAKPGGDEMHLVVTDSERPTLNAERAVGAGGQRRTRGTYRLEPAGPGATRVRFELVTETAPARERALGPLLHAFLRRQNARALERLKAQLEAVPAARAA